MRLEQIISNRLYFYPYIFYKSATASTLSSAEPSSLSLKSYFFNTLKYSNVYLNQVESTYPYLIQYCCQATYFPDKSNDNIIDGNVKINDVRFSFNDVKFSFNDVRFSFSDVRFSFNDVKFSFNDVCYSFNDVKISFNDVRFSFNDVMFSFNDVKFSFNDVRFSFNDVDFRPDKALLCPNNTYVTNIYSIVYTAYLTQYLCLF